MIKICCTFFLYNLENSCIISLNNKDIVDELRRHNNDEECPAGGMEHNPIFIQSLLHEVNFDLFWNLQKQHGSCN